MSELDSIVARLLETYRTAVYEKDLDAFLSLYDTNVRVFDAWGVWQYEGKDAWAQSVDAWFSSLGDERVRVTFHETNIHGTGEIAFVSTIVTYAAVAPSGDILRSLQDRHTWGLLIEGSDAKILHAHSSAPANFENGKVMLHYEPAE